MGLCGERSEAELNSRLEMNHQPASIRCCVGFRWKTEARLVEAGLVVGCV